MCRFPDVLEQLKESHQPKLVVDECFVRLKPGVAADQRGGCADVPQAVRIIELHKASRPDGGGGPADRHPKARRRSSTNHARSRQLLKFDLVAAQVDQIGFSTRHELVEQRRPLGRTYGPPVGSRREGGQPADAVSAHRTPRSLASYSLGPVRPCPDCIVRRRSPGEFLKALHDPLGVEPLEAHLGARGRRSLLGGCRGGRICR